MFESLSLTANVSLFVMAAGAVWLAGARLAHYADAIAEKTGIARAVLGIVVLGSVTSLPELAVGVTSAVAGAPLLSVNDVLGSAALNVLILALADAALGRSALTSTPANPGVLLQGVLGVLLLAIVAAAVTTGDVLVFGVGAWCWLLLAMYVGAVWMVTRSRGDAWVPARAYAREQEQASGTRLHERPLWRLVAGTAAVGAVILVAGYPLATTGERLAEETGLGVSFFGAVFLAISTSLPEVSTVLAAVRLRRYEMAIADVFGTNLFNVTIIVVVDALYSGEPVLAMAGPFATAGALLAIVLTVLFLAGMIERRDRTVWRMGVDSLAAIVAYLSGLVVLYHLR